LFQIVDSSGAAITPVTSVSGATSATGGRAVFGELTATPSGYVFVWVDERNGDSALFTTVVDATGTRTQPVSRVTSSGMSSSPAVSWGPRGTAIAWREGINTRAGWFTGTDVLSTMVSTSATVTPSGMAIAVDVDEATVMWTDNRSGTNDLRAASVGCP
jgi:hypothetical protein